MHAALHKSQKRTWDECSAGSDSHRRQKSPSLCVSSLTSKGSGLASDLKQSIVLQALLADGIIMMLHKFKVLLEGTKYNQI